MPFCNYCTKAFHPPISATGERYWCCIECSEELAHYHNDRIQLYENLFIKLRAEVETLFKKLGFALPANALKRDSYDDTLDGIPLPALQVADLDLYWFCEASTGTVKLQLSGTSCHSGSRYNPPEIEEVEIETIHYTAISYAARKLAHVWLDQLIDAHADENFPQDDEAAKWRAEQRRLEHNKIAKQVDRFHD